MFRRIPGLQLGLEHCRSPFDPHPDLVGQHYLFIYLTGRGEYIYLFPLMPEHDILDAAAQAIPMGYTQIWILEWVNAVRLELGKKLKPSQRRAAYMLRQDQIQERRSYVLIGEQGQCFGGTDKRQAALGAAKAIASERRIRIAVGLLTANVTWH
jgi:hypothetical protein